MELRLKVRALMRMLHPGIIIATTLRLTNAANRINDDGRDGDGDGDGDGGGKDDSGDGGDEDGDDNGDDNEECENE